MNYHIEELIQKLNRQQCSEAEIDFLLNYLNTGDQEALKEHMARQWQQQDAAADPEALKEEIWRQLAAAKGKGAEKELFLKERRRQRRLSAFIKYAAVFIGLIIISLFILKYQSPAVETDAITVELGEGAVENLEDQELSTLESKGIVLEENRLVYPPADTVRKPGKIEYHTIRIPRGRKFQLILSDGSKVFLNSGTTFRYPVTFIKGQDRQVSLDGEAFFTVAKKTEEKFLVLANSLETEVLGTEFNISTQEKAGTAIVLLEGSIRLNAEDPVTLVPNERLTVSASGDILVEKVEAEEYIQWIYGITWFEEEAFEDIVPRLERRFDVNIRNEYEELRDFRFTGRFETEGLKEILEVFKIVTDFRYEIRGKEVIIKPPHQ